MLEDIDPAKDIVRRAYKTVLDRQPDPQGLDSYSQAIASKHITEEQLYTILKNSNEYKARNVFLSVQTLSKFEGRIVYIQEIYINDIHNCLENLLNFRDNEPTVKCVVIYDDTISKEHIKTLTDAGAWCRYSKWIDDLPRQRNAALQEARILEGNWVLSSDPDEHFNSLLIKNLRSIIQSAIFQGYDMLKINCHDYDRDIKFQSTTNYYKDLLFELKHGVCFQGYGNLPTWHEGVVGLKKAIRLPKEYYYIHSKSRVDMIEHHTQGMFIVGGGPNLGAENPTWVELRRITDELKIMTWDEMNTLMKKGNVPKELKEFMIRHKDDNKKDGDQNVRAMFQYYFEVLHPEENTQHLTNIDFTIRSN